MKDLTPEEYELLEILLSKAENRHFVMATLVRVVLEKYRGNKTRAARALDYSIRGMRNICREQKQKILQ